MENRDKNLFDGLKKISADKQELSEEELDSVAGGKYQCRFAGWHEVYTICNSKMADGGCVGWSNVSPY